MITYILSCEHASNDLPEAYKDLYALSFRQTHRGYDRGAFDAFKALQASLNLWGIAGDYSRLLIDLNRSLDSPGLFSFRSDLLEKNQKQQIVDTIYKPYRNAVFNKVKEEVSKGNQVIHLSLHSFTPILRGVKRSCDVGLLYDPARSSEFQLCQRFFNALSEIPRLRVAHNQPYSGTDDGLTTYLRSHFSNEHYAGIEIEFNQRLVRQAKFNSIIASLQNFLSS